VAGQRQGVQAAGSGTGFWLSLPYPVQAAGRRLELLAGRTADAALLALYEEVAAVWRRLHELGDKKARLQQLRCAARHPMPPRLGTACL
jgi:hypothetical protein